MDYIERERHRLKIDLHVLTCRWHGTLSRMFILRDRLDSIDPTDAEAFSQAANTLGAFANDATSLKRYVDKAKRRLASFDVDAQRQANADVDGSCRYLTIDGGRCGRPTVEGSRWSGRHVGLWSDNMAEHIIREWRGLYVEHGPDGDFARCTHVLRVSGSELRATVDESRRELAQGYETVAVSSVRAEGQHRSCPRIRRERRPLPPIVVPIVMTMFAVLWPAGMVMLIWLMPMSAYVPYMREAATGVCAVSAVVAAIPVWVYAESSDVGDA